MERRIITRVVASVALLSGAACAINDPYEDDPCDGDEVLHDASASASAGGATTEVPPEPGSVPWCLAMEYRGTCRGTLCEDYFGNVDAAEKREDCEGIMWSWSDVPCEPDPAGGWCTVAGDDGCQLQSYGNASVAETLCGAYGGEYTPPE